MMPNPATPEPTVHGSNSLTLALVYAAFSGMWILFSDQAMVWLFSDPADYAMASTFKGLFFVMVTSLLLYGLLRRLEGGMATMSIDKGVGWPTLLMVVLVVGLTAVVIQHSLARGDGLAVAAWIGMAGLLTLIAVGAVLLILRQRAQLQLAKATRNAQDERLRALKLLAAIADSSEDAIFALDLEGRFVMANRVVLADTGKTLDELLGKDESSFFPPELAIAVMSGNQWVLAHGVGRTVEETLPLAGGERTLLTTKSPLRDESGKIIGLLGISRDITERKVAEDALRASEQRFHDIVNASADWIWEVDVQGRYTYASESVHDLLGYAPAEILGMTPFDLMPPAEAERVRDEFADIMARQAPFRDLDNINLHKDGSPRHVSTNGIAILAADGSLLGYRGLDRDITERKQAELDRQASEEKIRAFYELNLVGLTITSPEKGWVRINDCLCKMLEFSEQELREMTWAQLTHPDDLAADVEQFSRLLAREIDGYSMKKRFISRTGKVIYTQLVVRCVRKSSGEVDYVVAMVEDITAREHIEQELRNRNLELERFNRATVGRELDMVELKKRINALSQELGRQPPYPLTFLKDAAERGTP